MQYTYTAKFLHLNPKNKEFPEIEWRRKKMVNFVIIPPLAPPSQGGDFAQF
jgi:hypothetical protein